MLLSLLRMRQGLNAGHLNSGLGGRVYFYQNLRNAPVIQKGTGRMSLSLGVMPDEFHIVCSHIDGHDHKHIPSILILNRKEMREMIEGAVAYLRDEKRYGDKFHWVTLPDKDLRS